MHRYSEHDNFNLQLVLFQTYRHKKQRLLHRAETNTTDTGTQSFANVQYYMDVVHLFKCKLFMLRHQPLAKIRFFSK